jgi:F-type H+-transporting ATPase subunit gamma
MANILDIRRRIRSVKNTQQITRAMKFVAAARLRKSQDRMLASRPYAHSMLTVLNSLALRVNAENHPLLAARNDNRIEVIVVTGEKGLCGAFNSNIIKASWEFLENLASGNKEFQLDVVGRKGRDFYRRRQYRIRTELVNVLDKIAFDQAAALGNRIIDSFTQQEMDAVYIVYNEFKSVIQQKVVIEQLLPIVKLGGTQADIHLDYIYEQSPAEIMSSLLPLHVKTQIFHSMLESAAAEQAARMTAMDAATNNAGEMIEKLTLSMNRTRQASITREIIEVVSGANAIS